MIGGLPKVAIPHDTACTKPEGDVFMTDFHTRTIDFTWEAANAAYKLAQLAEAGHTKSIEANRMKFSDKHPTQFRLSPT